MRVIEDTVPVLQHLDRSAVAAFEVCGEVVAKNRHQLAVRRPHVRWQVSLSTALGTLGRKENQLWEPGCREPRKIAVVAEPSQREASVTVQSVPANCRRLESFAAHRLHGIEEDRVDVPDCVGQTYLATGIADAASNPNRMAANVAIMLRRRRRSASATRRSRSGACGDPASCAAIAPSFIPLGLATKT